MESAKKKEIVEWKELHLMLKKWRTGISLKVEVKPEKCVLSNQEFVNTVVHFIYMHLDQLGMSSSLIKKTLITIIDQSEELIDANKRRRRSE